MQTILGLSLLINLSLLRMPQCLVGNNNNIFAQLVGYSKNYLIKQSNELFFFFEKQNNYTKTWP
jgi:hypothetical protein